MFAAVGNAPLFSSRTWNAADRSRPGARVLSWNYWVADSFILPASPEGRPRGKFLSNALCPSNGADINGPTANVNSIGKVLGGRAPDGKGDWDDYLNLLPNGGSHTMTFNPSLLRDGEHREKFKAFLRGYVENGGSALQINLVDAEMLRDAQKHPEAFLEFLLDFTRKIGGEAVLLPTSDAHNEFVNSYRKELEPGLKYSFMGPPRPCPRSRIASGPEPPTRRAGPSCKASRPVNGSSARHPFPLVRST